VSNREAKFVSTATYIDSNGREYQFHRKGGEVSIAEKVSPVDSPLAWSVLWKVVWIEKFQKTMAEMTEKEVDEYYSGGKSEGSLNIFAAWFMEGED
jgi:inosine/xanthosine triphosphate pyrophosphatase family protein